MKASEPFGKEKGEGYKKIKKRGIGLVNFLFYFDPNTAAVGREPVGVVDL